MITRSWKHESDARVQESLADSGTQRPETIAFSFFDCPPPISNRWSNDFALRLLRIRTARRMLIVDAVVNDATQRFEKLGRGR